MDLVAITQTGGTAPSPWTWWGGNPLDPAATPPPTDRPVLCRSGWFGAWTPQAGGTPEFRTWSPAGWEGLWAWCERLAGDLRAHSGQICLLPHARHVVADPQSAGLFLRGVAERGWEGVLTVGLDPGGLLTREMLPRLPEHAERMREALAPRAEVVLAAGGDPTDDGSMRAVPMERSSVDAARLLEVVVAARDRGAQVLAPAEGAAWTAGRLAAV